MPSPIELYRPTVRAARDAVRAGTPVMAVVERLRVLAEAACTAGWAHCGRAMEWIGLDRMLCAYAEGLEDGSGQ